MYEVKHIGNFAVDSGQITIVDPCYIGEDFFSVGNGVWNYDKTLGSITKVLMDLHAGKRISNYTIWNPRQP